MNQKDGKTTGGAVAAAAADADDDAVASALLSRLLYCELSCVGNMNQFLLKSKQKKTQLNNGHSKICRPIT